MCQVKSVTPVLIHQATDQVAQQNASVYSVQPYFPDGVISFYVQCSPAPSGFNLKASTTIAAGSIGTDPEPNLVLVPKNMKPRVSKYADETATIMAVTFDYGDNIAYHVQLNNGTIVKLYGDKYVHNIDLIDLSAPPILSILTSHTLSHVKRDPVDHYEDANTPMRAAPATIEKRGVEAISSYTATFSEDACRSIACLNNGGRPAMFNPFLNSCSCQTLVPSEKTLSQKAERSQPHSSEGLARREMDDSLLRSVFQIAKPSSETCRHMIACQGESKPYFAEESSQCLCVVYRIGVKEPVIASDTTIFPRAEQAVNLEEENSLRADNKALAQGWATDSTDMESFCSDESGFKHCLGKTVARWNKDHTSCVCANINVIESSVEIEDTSKTLQDTHVVPYLDKRTDWYLICSDHLHECLSDPYRYRCDSNRKMINYEQNDLCDRNCECGGLHLDGCLSPRGGCSWSRPDHPGTNLRNRRALDGGLADLDKEV